MSPVNIINNDQLIMDLPSTGTDPVQTVSDSMNINEESMNINEGEVVHERSLIKLSHLPKCQWHCLQYMDSIKVFGLFIVFIVSSAGFRSGINQGILYSPSTRPPSSYQHYRVWR